ncbi:MAG TPA: hypothetical protein VGF22_11915 [Acidimicrobiales bacterium]|jgi:hypothetical protein
MSEPTMRFHIVLGRRDEIVRGPDGADLVITVNRADVGLEPTVAYMQGRLKAVGNTGLLFEALRSGAVAKELAAHAASL